MYYNLLQRTLKCKTNKRKLSPRDKIVESRSNEIRRVCGSKKGFTAQTQRKRSPAFRSDQKKLGYHKTVE